MIWVYIAIGIDAIIGLLVLFGKEGAEAPKSGPMDIGGMQFTRIVIGDHCYKWRPWSSGGIAKSIFATMLFPITILVMPMLCVLVLFSPVMVGYTLNFLGGFSLMQVFYSTVSNDSDVSRSWSGIGEWQH